MVDQLTFSQAQRRKLHLGCGRDVREGWVNLDLIAGPGIDAVCDLDQCDSRPLPFEADTIDEVLGSHLIEHIRNPLPMMQELHRVCRNGARAVFRTPHGGSDDAFEDPTHVRQLFPGSFMYFAQPMYWRADYGYRGDWQPEAVILRVRPERLEGKTPDQLIAEITHLRNAVLEMCVVLRCVKPIRPPNRDLIASPSIEIVDRHVEP